ncbi:DEAD/DEAH box helicase [Desulfobotulus mexicanus]|uniref:DEAD/DEAH box helicase n=1 Tax=Desulfobotulus mexicanus TaxID=2586642 RepID=A0A5Q4VCF7_9BACT|nr:DEAD/DEAH box helicase [Desulfobotulus mexicanus]TYT74653.1 DEAD/DEAH box helicase [Desulfobotulus mexicanus]
MIFLHASWLDGRLHLWAETQPESPFVPKSPRGRKPLQPKAKIFPYDPSNLVLGSVLKKTFPEIRALKKDFRTASLFLPTLKGCPLPSSPLIAQLPEGNGEPLSLHPWLTSTLVLDWQGCRTLLGRCMDGPLLEKGVFAGSDLLWWAQMLRFVASLAVKGAYLPAVQRGERGDFYARWQPLPHGEDYDTLARLEAAMPESCRCLGPENILEAPAINRREILYAFTAFALDALVRESMGTRIESRSASSIHDAWLAALGSGDARFVWKETSALEGLETQLLEWRRPLEVSASARARLCFRLEEPESGDEETWQVRYLLQPYEDPSLMLPLEVFWKKQSVKTKAFHAVAGDVGEYLLSAIAHASTICGAAKESLSGKKPKGHTLDNEGAWRFLAQEAPVLESTGFGVILPGWWLGKSDKNRIRLKALVKSPSMKAAAGLGLETLMKVDWEVALGDSLLSLKELEALAGIKGSLVRMKGVWMEVDGEKIRQTLAFLKKKMNQEMKASEIMHMALGVASEHLPLEVEEVKAEGWMKDLLKGLKDGGRLKPVALPESFCGTLRPYQQQGFSWLYFLKQWGLGACLADDMGLGKTVQTLSLVAKAREEGEKRPVLLVCPTSLVGNWRREAARFTPDLKVMTHHGNDRKKEDAFRKEAMEAGLVISSYGLLQRDGDFLSEMHWAGAILDEAQNIKNGQTGQSKAARMLKADYRIALTGTPVENHVGDLWAMMAFLNPGLLGSQAAFKKNFFTPIQIRGDAGAAQMLKRITGPFVLRRVKTDKKVITDLPDKQEMKVFCTLTKEQASLYRATLKDMEAALESSEGIQRKGMVLAALSKLKQICNHPAHFLGDGSAVEGRSGKLERLTEMMEEVLAAGEKALIFSQFKEMGYILKKHLQQSFGQEVLFLHGGTPVKDRDTMVSRFQAGKSGPKIFVLSLKAGGTGLNLTEASHVFHYDRWWNPAVENQATDRAFRIGQKMNVQVHKFLCAGTLEERIDAMIEKKSALSESIVGSGEGWVTELSASALKKVLALSKEAVGE